MSNPSDKIDVVVDYKKGVSDVFSMFSHKWVLKAIPDNGDPFRLLGVYLVLSDGSPLKGSISLATSISLDKADGREGETKSETLVFTSANLELGFEDFVIVDGRFESKFLKENNLVFHISVEKEKPLAQVKSGALPTVSTPQATHSEHIRLVQPSVSQGLAVYSHSSSPQPTHPTTGSPYKIGSPSGPFSPLNPINPGSRPSSAAGSSSRPTSAARPTSALKPLPNSRPGSATGQAMYTATSSPTSGKEVSTVSNVGGVVVVASKSASPAGTKVLLPSLTGK